MNASLLFNNFTGGETSPLFAARVDSPAYAMGAKRLRNFIPMITGGVRKRPGTWLYKTAVNESKTRVIEWATGLRGDNARLLLVLSGTAGPLVYIDIYREAEDAPARRLPLSGINTEELFELQYAVTGEADASTLWLVHRKMPPRSLTARENTLPEEINTPEFFETYETDRWEDIPLTENTDYEGSTAYSYDVRDRIIAADTVFTLKKALPAGAVKFLGDVAVKSRYMEPDFWPLDSSMKEFGGPFAAGNEYPVNITLSYPIPMQISQYVYATYTVYCRKYDAASKTWEDIYLTEGTDYEAATAFRAFGNVRIIAADTVFTLKNALPAGAVVLRCGVTVWTLLSSGFRTAGTGKAESDGTGGFPAGAQFPAAVTMNYPFESYLEHKAEYKAWYRRAVPPGTRPVFNAPGKYPGAVAVYAGRLCFGGTDEYPSRIWLSRPPDSITGQNRYLEFTAGANPADAIVIEENDMEGSRVLWLAAGRRLAAGTARATWSDNGAVPTPSSFDMNIVEYIGGNSLAPRGTKEILVYAGRNGKTLRALVWQETERGAGFVDTDISRNAAHLFASGIRDFDVTDYPYPVIWAVAGDGTLASCTIDIRSGVVAWARHETAGKFESCAARREDGRNDTLFLAAERPEGGTRDIVTLTLDELVHADYAESHYVDCGIRVELDPPSAEVPLPEPLRRDGLQAFADGAQETVRLSEDKSTAIFRQPVKAAHIGLPYKSELSPNTPEIPANGTSVGKKRRIEKALLRVYGSLGGRCGITENKAVPIPYMRYGRYRLGEAPEPFTGDINMTVGGTIDPEGKLAVTHGEPVPFTLLALVERVAILEA